MQALRNARNSNNRAVLLMFSLINVENTDEQSITRQTLKADEKETIEKGLLFFFSTGLFKFKQCTEQKKVMKRKQ
jgi:hypothetical protein